MRGSDTVSARGRATFLILLLSLAFGLAFTMSLTSNVSTAHAACGGPGSLCGSLGDAHSGGGSGGSKPSHSSPSTGGHSSGGSSSGSGGSSGSSSSYIINVPGSNGCPLKQGKAALGIAQHWYRMYAYGDTPNGPDNGGYGYRYIGVIYTGGYDGTVGNRIYKYEKDFIEKTTCLYPSMTVKKNIVCSISYTVEIDKVEPNAKTLGKETRNTNYRQGSKDYNACISSSGSVNASQGVSEYGYYKVLTYQKAQNAVAEIATTVNQWTGSYDKPKIVSLSPPYNTSPKVAMTASLDCRYGWKNPGVRYPEYWTDAGCMGDVANSYKCVVKPVQIDGADGTATKMRPLNTGDTLQVLRDGKNRKMTFNQTISSKNISVKTTHTRFLRTGTPWVAGRSPQLNTFELRLTPTGNSVIQTNGKGTANYSGIKNTVYATGYDASNPNGKTSITQEINFTGTRTIKSGRIVSINASKGTVSVDTFTTKVPTSGRCSQTVSLEYLRTIQDQMM